MNVTPIRTSPIRRERGDLHPFIEQEAQYFLPVIATG
jgi:hypothetical protein